MGVKGRMHTGKIDISVIIPAYNAEAYLQRAVESVLCQKALSWELILVENGSTDETARLCQEMARKDARIRVYHSEKGVSRARNKGLDEAVGKWICFLDADDYLYMDAFECLGSVIQTEGETAVGDVPYDIILFDHNSDSTSVPGMGNQYLTPETFLALRCRMLENPTKYMTVWGKLFLAEQIRERRVRFREDLELAEDADFSFRFLQGCMRAYVLEAQLYHYSRDNVSAVREYHPGKADKYLKSMEAMKVYLATDCAAIQEAFSCFVAMHLLLILVHDTFASENPAGIRERKRQFRELLNRAIIAESIRRIPFRKCRSIRMLPVLCLKCKLNVIVILVVKFRIWLNAAKNSQ